MAKTLDHVAYLSQEIGPRPAGTEEEQQAALYITEQLQKDAGLSTVIEDFTGASDSELTFIILSAVSAVVSVATLLLSALAVPAIIITIVAAVLTVLERFGRPIVSGLLSRGVSQNVVAQYKPAYSDEGPGLRRRKIVLVANYDSGKVRVEMVALAGVRPILNWAALGAMVALPLFLIIRYVGFIHASGALAVVLNVILVIIAIVSLIPVFFGIAHKIAAYNDAANCNAAGIAVMLDVASRIGKGRMSEAELSHDEAGAVIHGESAAREAGVVPDGAELVYETPAAPAEPDLTSASAEDRLAAAKAAVAAMTGKPVSTHPARSVSKNLVKVKEQPLGALTEDQMKEVRDETRAALTSASEIAADEPVVGQAEFEAETAAGIAPEPRAAVVEGAAQVAAAAPVAAATAVAYTAPRSSGLPAWYVEAQKKAKRQPEPSSGSAIRSRYADALEAAEAEGMRRAEQNAHLAEESVLSSQIRQLQEGIQGVKAPRIVRTEEPESTGEAAVPEAQAVEEHGASADAAQPAGAVSSELQSQPKPQVEADVSMQPAVEPTVAPAPAVEGTQAFTPVPIDIDAVRAAARSSRATERREVASQGEASVAPEPQPVEPVARETSPAAVLPLDAIPLFSSADEAAIVNESVAEAVELPDLGENAPHVAPVSDAAKQRAPLAAAAESKATAAKSLLSMLPSLSGSFSAVKADDDAEKAPAGGAVRAHDRAGMRTTLPSLSGSITRQGSIAADAGDLPASTSVGTAGMTGAFAPVGEELLKDVDADDIFVDDADDSVYDEGNFTETGAFAGPGYVEMPSSRIGGFFGRFKRNKNRKADGHETSPQEWLDVDEDFDAREVGKARGTWESFREGSDNDESVEKTTAWSPNDVADAEGDGRQWDDAADARESWNDGWNESWDDGWNDDESTDGQPVRRDVDENGRASRRRWHGGAFSRLRLGRKRDAAEADGTDDDGAIEAREGGAGPVSTRRTSRRAVQRPTREEVAIERELEQIYRFRNPDIATEVWFVALGSELAGHGGMKAFLAEHASDLRGAIIIQLEGLGAGTLSYIDREGGYRKRAASSRMGRYVNKASKETGISVPKTQLSWSESTTAYAMERGIQALHLAGVDGPKVALNAEADDVLGNIDEQKLEEASDFVIALLKNI